MPNGTEYIRQAAAIPIQGGRICLITSSNGKRWVIPKGLIEVDQSAGQTALQEAWEEAGVVGVLQPHPVGAYLYEKYGGTCHVTVFALHVTEVSDNWPERDLRQRTWVRLPGALQRIEDEGLRDLILAAMRRSNVRVGT